MHRLVNKKEYGAYYLVHEFLPNNLILLVFEFPGYSLKEYKIKTR